MTPELRWYQESGLSEFARRWREGFRRGLLVSPTGSGKTIAAMEMVRRAVARGKHCLFVTDRRLLTE